MRIRWMAAALVLVSLVGVVVRVGYSGGSETAGPFSLVDTLPADFRDAPLMACVVEDGSLLSTVVGYRSTVHEERETYTETAFLRMFISSAMDVDGDRTENALERLVTETADPESQVAAEVSGHKAIEFTVSTAEPTLAPWPAFAWEADGYQFVVLGEGMDRGEVIAAAESVRTTTEEEFRSFSSALGC